ncbi:hypothetical protein [Chryseolinea lacunae]|uniref:HPt domain-containing protein n=1 Tax=Chryseolinea lacunae TaxID=2801331 RepID=A0ABS1L2C2_9BACT|nr:hypothetical protein [Chryseolinea lacunae]MBL0745826.1 hypothetical protein [Chryseolinea lacunae]
MKINMSTTGSAPHTEHFFDLHKFMRLTDQNDQIMFETCEAFVTYTPAMVQELRHEAERCDPEGLRKALHKLKSSTAMFAVEGLTVEMSGLDKCDFMDTEVLKHRICLIVGHVERLVMEVRMFLMSMTITASKKF